MVDVQAILTTPVNEMAVVKSMNKNGLGTKIPTDTMLQIDGTWYRVYEHNVVWHAQSTRNFEYVTIRKKVYRVENIMDPEYGDPNRRIIRLEPYVGLFGF